MLARVKKDSTKTASGYFNQIAAAALDQDQDEIDQLLSKDFFTLDVKWGVGFGLITPACFHEIKGNTNASEFLMRNGADVDYMGFGAAIKGDMTRADHLRKRYGANPSLIARGAAYSGYENYAKWLVLYCGADPFDVVLGLVLAKRYETAKEFITSFAVRMDIHRASELWQAIGMTEGNLTPALKEIYTLLDGSYANDNDEKDYKKHRISLGAGLSGNYELSEDADNQTKDGFYHGAIMGGHLDSLPPSYYQPQPNNFDNSIYFDLKDALLGSNINFLERCYEENESNRATRTAYLRWLYFKTKESNDLQLIRCVPQRSNIITELFKYGGTLTENFDFIHPWEHTFKALSFMFKTCNKNLIDRLDIHYFLHFLPNADMTRHLLTFDDNPDFHKKLLERFDSFEWESSLKKAWKFDFHQVMSDANKIRILMDKYQLNYDQAFAFIQSADLRNFLVYTCKDITEHFDRDVFSIIISNLSTLSGPDAADLIAKIRYHRHTIQDILHIADHFKDYASTHANEQSSHAASIANVLTETRKNEEALDVLSHEMQLLQTAKTERAQSGQPFASIMKSAAGLFNAAKSHLNNDQTLAHLKSYKKDIADDGYEKLVSNSMATINSKLNR